MKKTIYATLAFLFNFWFINAQEIGVRFGEIVDNTVAVDGVFDFKGSRIHADVSFGDDLGIDALWDFVYKPSFGLNGIYWYAGVGPSLVLGDDFFLGASGEIGLEYLFDKIPITVGIDYRPTLWIVEDTDIEWVGFGINVRYRF